MPWYIHIPTDVHFSSTSIRQPKATQQHPCQIKRKTTRRISGSSLRKQKKTLRRHGS